MISEIWSKVRISEIGKVRISYIWTIGYVRLSDIWTLGKVRISEIWSRKGQDFRDLVQERLVFPRSTSGRRKYIPFFRSGVDACIKIVLKKVKYLGKKRFVPGYGGT